MKGIIYLVTNIDNGKIYVGKSTQRLKKRISNHYQNSKISNSHFYNALKKYPKENFNWEILEEIEIENKILLNEKLNKLEKLYIERFNSTNRDVGYNMTTGGEGCFLMEDVKEKIRKAQIGENNSMYKKIPWNKGLKGYMVPWNKGIPCEEETKKKISKNRKGKTAGKNHPMYGKHQTEEAKQKISKSKIGVPMHEKTKEALKKANTGSIPWNKGLTKETDERVRKNYEK
jgi:GIY-YIG catalytic domain/NUMOD3 motif